MKFYDTVKITVHSGEGGNGIVAARKEACVPRGGPEGGNGGRGGDVFFVGNKHENTLQKYLFHHDYKATKGEPGRGKQQYGADGDDLYLTVPLGTIIKERDTGRILHQITQEGEKWQVLSGGEGGVGNMHFATSTLQYPEYAILGEPGQKWDLLLELQLLGDVALIGTPSVGKSTLINACSNAKAKVAEYHFTTLVPNLGMCRTHGQDFTMIDIPGLIEGAHDGKGLGNKFLRHILKAHVFAFVHDMHQYETGMDDALKLLEEIRLFIHKKYIGSTEYDQPIEDVSFEIEEINNQLHMKVYLHFPDEKRLFLDKMMMFVLNKYDLIQDDEIVAEYASELRKYIKDYFSKTFDSTLSDEFLEANTVVVSGATHHGTDKLLSVIGHKMKTHDFTNQMTLDFVEKEEDFVADIVDITESELPFLMANAMVPEDDADLVQIWQVNKENIIRTVFVTMWGNDQGEHHFWNLMDKQGFATQAREAGVRYGDILKISKGKYKSIHDKYIQWML